MQSGVSPSRPREEQFLSPAHAQFMAGRLQRMDLAALREFAEQYLPLDSCERFGIVPLGFTGRLCTIGVCNPKMVGLWDGLEKLERQGIVVRAERIPAAVHAEILKRLQTSTETPSETTAPVTNGLTSIGASIISSDSLVALTQELQSESNASDEDLGNENAPVVRVLRNLLGEALQRGVSDIHIEPLAESCRIRLRKDGILHAVASLPPVSLAPLIARIKVLAKLNIAEKRLPQDGALRFEQNGQSYDIRVSTLPGRYGEKGVLRILSDRSIQLDLDTLILEDRERRLLREMSRRPHGILVVCGPTGSGKTTTLYSLLRERNETGINILTVEDPIEYTLPGIHQVQIIREKGYDFARALRAFMRQDPDVILVGETRDPETAKTAVQASLTGHLVLTTLHANDALSTIPRLAEMGIEPYLMSSSLLGVCAQRLVRRVCPDCSSWTEYPGARTRDIGLPEGGRFRQAYEHHQRPTELNALDGGICPTCNGLGYVGRLGVYEVIVVDDTLRGLMAAGAPMERIKQYVHNEQGIPSLLGYAHRLLAQGLTTVEEVERVCQSL